MLLVSSTALILSCAAFFIYEIVAYRASLQSNMTVLAEVIAQNSTGALSFDDPDMADKTLGALRAEPLVLAACLFKGETNRWAAYSGTESPAKFPALPGPDGGSFGPEGLDLFRPVMLDNKRIGTIYIRADLRGVGERVRLYLGIGALIFIGSCLLTFGLLPTLRSGITDPILALAETARDISEKKDYSVRAKKEADDEIGRLTDALNGMLSEIEAGQHALQSAHQSLLMQTGQIMESVGVLSTSVRQILDFSTQVATSASETATAITQTTTTVEEVRHTSQMAAQKARAVADAALKAAQISQEGKKSAELASEGMHRIRQQMESIADSMMRLSEQSQTIGQIIASVEDLAAQSNLLAVNAAIEAAKAGEQGKGFAVVAQEIKNLAEQSKQATKQVRGILSDIQKATGAAVMATEQGARAVESGVQQSSQAGESIITLAVNVAEAAQASTQIAASSQQQYTGMDQIVSSMMSVKQATTQNVTSARDLEAAAHNLNELGQRLKKLVQEYRV
jgi:methyl-accepting chemotaxis protein